MSVAPARRAPSSEPRRRPRAPASGSAARARSAERRRRERHFQRRRRDLLQDVGAALLLAILLVSVTAGLGVVALIEVPLAAALIITRLAERGLRRRRTGSRQGARRVRV